MDNSNPVSFAVTSQPVPTGWLNGDFGVVYVEGSTAPGAEAAPAPAQ